MDFEVTLDHGQFEHGQEVHSGFFKASGDTSGVLEPAHAPLDDIATHLGVSTYRLSHVFGQESDFTVSGYLTMLRMEKARAMLLAHSRCNVSEVARTVGYQDPHYFSRVFKKHYGQSPAKFRSS